MTNSADTIREFLESNGIPFDEPKVGTFVAVLPGEHKLNTTVSLVAGEHSLSINAFVARKPDENEAAVHAWLLERNRKLFAVSFCIDHLGDIYLAGKLPLSSASDVDRILGSVLEYSDGAFNTILELGFPNAIRREFEWRQERGESIEHLSAFRHLIQPPDQEFGRIEP